MTFPRKKWYSFSCYTWSKENAQPSLMSRPEFGSKKWFHKSGLAFSSPATWSKKCTSIFDGLTWHWVQQQIVSEISFPCHMIQKKCTAIFDDLIWSGLSDKAISALLARRLINSSLHGKIYRGEIELHVAVLLISVRGIFRPKFQFLAILCHNLIMSYFI